MINKGENDMLTKSSSLKTFFSGVDFSAYESKTGEFIHGCRSYEKTFESTPDRYVSGGCMRMANEVIAELAPTVEKGEIVIIK